MALDQVDRKIETDTDTQREREEILMDKNISSLSSATAVATAAFIWHSSVVGGALLGKLPQPIQMSQLADFHSFSLNGTFRLKKMTLKKVEKHMTDDEHDILFHLSSMQELMTVCISFRNLKKGSQQLLQRQN